MNNDDTYGKYGCWWEGGTGVSPEGNQCGECYPNFEEECQHLLKYKQIEEIGKILLSAEVQRLGAMDNVETAVRVVEIVYSQVAAKIFSELDNIPWCDFDDVQDEYEEIKRRYLR